MKSFLPQDPQHPDLRDLRGTCQAGYTLGLGRMYDRIPVVAHHAWLK